jgi:hypothetical protein
VGGHAGHVVTAQAELGTGVGPDAAAHLLQHRGQFLPGHGVRGRRVRQVVGERVQLTVADPQTAGGQLQPAHVRETAARVAARVGAEEHHPLPQVAEHVLAGLGGHRGLAEPGRRGVAEQGVLPRRVAVHLQAGQRRGEGHRAAAVRGQVVGDRVRLALLGVVHAADRERGGGRAGRTAGLLQGVGQLVGQQPVAARRARVVLALVGRR